MLNKLLVKKLLKQHHLFSSLTIKQIDKLLEHAKEYELAADERIFNQGQKADRFYFVVTGNIKLLRVASGGNEKVIEIINQNNTFAEAVMFMERKQYPVTAKTISEATLISINNATFIEMISQESQICFDMLAHLSMRVHACMNDIELLTMQNAKYRVARYLIDHIDGRSSNKDTVSLEAPKHIVASRLAISPETFSRVISSLVAKNIIDMKGKKISINDVQVLREMSGYNEQEYDLPTSRCVN